MQKDQCLRAAAARTTSYSYLCVCVHRRPPLCPPLSLLSLLRRLLPGNDSSNNNTNTNNNQSSNSKNTKMRQYCSNHVQKEREYARTILIPLRLAQLPASSSPLMAHGQRSCDLRFVDAKTSKSRNQGSSSPDFASSWNESGRYGVILGAWGCI